MVSLLLAAQPGPSAAAPAVQWRELRVPSRSAHAMVWDSRRERALLLGGDSQNGSANASCWKLVQGTAPRWEPLSVAGVGPLRRAGIAAVYDSLRDRVLVFGGRHGYGDAGSNELWALSVAGQPTWTLLDVSAGAMPDARSHASVILDAQDRLVMFGGEGLSTSDSSVWLLPLSESPLAWQAVPLPGTGPGPRARHGAVYSPVTHRMTVFGGDRKIVDQSWVVDYVIRPAITWELVLGAPLRWVRRASAPADSVPVPSTGSSFVADRAGETAWWFPGDQGFVTPDASVWRLDLLMSTWTRIQSGAGGPGIRAAAAAAAVPATGEVLLHGGASFIIFGAPGGKTTATWRFHAPDPEPWSTAVPVPAEALSPTRDRRVHFDLPTRRLITWTSQGVWTNELALDGAWRLDPAGAMDAPPYSDPVSVLEPSHRRLLVFGGLDAARRSVVPDRLWAWPLDGPGAWTTVAIDGPAPLGTWGMQSIYDPARDRVMVLPSASRFESILLARLDSVSVLELAGPSPRWVRLATSGGPPTPRAYASIILDRARDRLVLQGGAYPSDDGTHLRDLWTLSLAGRGRWTNVIPPSFDFGIVTQQGLLLDPTSDRLMLIGGASQSIMDLGDRNTLYSAPIEELTGWSDLDPEGLSPMYGGGVAFLDAVQERALFWNGTLWEITWPFGPVDAPPTGPAKPGLAWSLPRPNPAVGQVTLELASGAETEVTVEVFDASGRRVGPVLRRRIGAGRTVFTLPLAHALPPGLYVVRAEAGVHAARATLVVTR